MNISYVAALLLFAWLVYGLVSIFRRKRRLMKRLGREKSNDDLIAAAKEGDDEAARLYRISKIYVAVGLVLGMLLVGSRFI